MKPKNWEQMLRLSLCLAFAMGGFACSSSSQQLTQAPPPLVMVFISPPSATVSAGTTQQFKATVTNDSSSKGVTWTISPSTGSGVLTNPTSTSVTYSAPAIAASVLNVTITATSVADPSQFASASAKVPVNLSGITVSLNPATAMLAPGASMDISGTTNDPSGVTWSLSPVGGGGSLPPDEQADQGGSLVALYNAPASISSTSLNVTVTATSISDPNVSASTIITVTTAIFVNVYPSSAFIQITGTVALSASVTNDANNAGVTWSVGGCAGSSSVCGSITNVAAAGTASYVAPAALPPGGQVSVIATSVTDPTKSASALITINPINFGSQNYPAGNSPDALAIGDFNSDGKLDVAVADYGNPSTGDSGGVSILLGNGDGTFQPAISVSAGKNPISIAVGDFNNDGKQDLVLATYGDRVTGGNGSVSVLLGNGDGTFQAPLALSAGNEPLPVVVGDFNGDGKLDFAVSDFDSGVYVFLGNGDGSFQMPTLVSAGLSPVAVVACDFNHDGKLDLAVADMHDPSSQDNGGVSVLLGVGDGSFQAPVFYPISLFPTSIVSGDLNVDGKPDLAISSFVSAFGLEGSDLNVLLGNGDGTFGSDMVTNTGRVFPLSVVIANFDPAGKADVAEVNGLHVAVFTGNGDGTLGGELFINGDQQPYQLGVADFNADGRPDVAVANQGSNDLTILLNTSNP